MHKFLAKWYWVKWMTEWEDDQDKLKEEGDGYVFVCMDENVKVLSCRSGKMAP